MIFFLRAVVNITSGCAMALVEITQGHEESHGLSLNHHRNSDVKLCTLPSTQDVEADNNFCDVGTFDACFYLKRSKFRS